jgi:hypothetical protein
VSAEDCCGRGAGQRGELNTRTECAEEQLERAEEGSEQGPGKLHLNRRLEPGTCPGTWRRRKVINFEPSRCCGRALSPPWGAQTLHDEGGLSLGSVKFFEIRACRPTSSTPRLRQAEKNFRFWSAVPVGFLEKHGPPEGISHRGSSLFGACIHGQPPFPGNPRDRGNCNQSPRWRSLPWPPVLPPQSRKGEGALAARHVTIHSSTRKGKHGLVLIPSCRFFAGRFGVLAETGCLWSCLS